MSASLLCGQPACGLGPCLDFVPVPGGPSTDGPARRREAVVPLPPLVHGVAAHIEALGDFDGSHGVTGSGHASDYCPETLDNARVCPYNQDMTFTEQLTEATAKRDAARIALDSAKTGTARRDAGEDLEFWMGKVAYLQAAVR